MVVVLEQCEGKRRTQHYNASYNLIQKKDQRLTVSISLFAVLRLKVGI